MSNRVRSRRFVGLGCAFLCFTGLRLVGCRGSRHRKRWFPVLDHRLNFAQGVARLTALAAVLALTVALAACGSSSSAGKSATDPANAGGGTSTRSSGSATTQPAGPAKAIDVCATVDAAKAAQLSGLAITTAKPVTGLNAMEYGCEYDNDTHNLGDNLGDVSLVVYEHGGIVTYNEYFQMSGKTVVSGVGDKAFYDGTSKTCYVLSGNSLINVSDVDGADKCTALAGSVLAAL